MEQLENAACTRAANGVVRTYALCMQQRGYRVNLSGPGHATSTPASSPQPQADSWAAARAAEQAGDFTEAMRLWRKVEAENGSRLLAQGDRTDVALIQSNIGRYYENGLGVQQNYTEAADWYKKSLQTEPNFSTEIDLGMLYAYGLGVPQDRAMARQLWVQSGAAPKLVKLLDNNALPKSMEDRGRFNQEITAAIAKLDEDEARKQEAEQQTEEMLGAAPSTRTTRPVPEDNTFGRVLCNKALDTSMFNILSPCNY